MYIWISVQKPEKYGAHVIWINTVIAVYLFNTLQVKPIGSRHLRHAYGSIQITE
jgi:hypothetical protein